MDNKNNKNLNSLFKYGILKSIWKKNIIKCVLIFIILILAGASLFYRINLYKKNKENEENEYKYEDQFINGIQDRDKKKLDDFFKHKTIKTEINGLKQVINIIEIYPGTEKIKIRPALSYNRIYGFEFLSEMIERHHAYAGINGGFFNEYGDPSGMVMIDGELITLSTGEFPVFIVSRGVAELKEQKTKLWLKTEKGKIELGGINTFGKPGSWILFTEKYGTNNRVKESNISILIKENIIFGIVESHSETEIPEGGMLATFVNSKGSLVDVKLTNDGRKMEYLEKGKDGISLQIGDRIELIYEPYLGSDSQAYECGGWIIKEGKVILGEYDPWIGVLTNRDPRTAIGIKEGGEVVLITVDGRQPGYSYGFTGQELANFLLEYGVENAAMLDGGASTEMIIDGEIINKPSFKGEERPLAGAILVEYID